MKRNFGLKFLLSGSVTVSTALFAAEAPAPTNAPTATNSVSLEALVADVVEHNPELNFYRAEIAAARGERRTAGTLANPEASATLGHKRVSAAGEGLAWSVSVQQTFEWPGRVPLRKAIANHQVTLADLGLAQFRTALAARARTLAYGLFAAQQKAAAAREVADRFQALREVLVQRDPAGLTPLLETRIIEATEITLQHQAAEAVIEAQAALLALNQLRGQPWEESLRIAQASLAFSDAPEIATLLAAARTNNFDLKMRQTELEQQGFKVSLAKNERHPSFSVGPYLSQERAGDRETQVGLGVTIPLSLWNRNKGGIEVAQAREAQAQTSLYVTQREIERNVAEQAIRYATRLNQMAKWRPDSVEQFRDAATLADRHYRLGAVPIATYVELQKQYLEAVEALLDTKREALEAGQEIQRLTGLDFHAVTVTEPKKEESK